MNKKLPKTWKELKLLDCLETDSVPTKIKLQTKQYLIEGKYPIIDQGEKYIAGYCNDEDKIYPYSNEVIIFGDHTKRFKYVNFQFCVGADGTKILVPKKELLYSKYFYYYLLTLKLEDEGYSRYYRFLQRRTVIIPPLSTQKHIVAILEKAEKIKEKRQITNEDTNKIIQSVFYEMFGDQAKIRARKVELNKLVEEFRYGTSVKSSNSGDPVLRIPNIIGDKINLIGLKYVLLGDKERSKILLKKGDILFVRTNGNPNYVGRSAVFNLTGEYVYASYLIKASTKKDLINPIYLVNFLRLPSERKQILRKCRTSAGQFNINTEGLGTLLIYVPKIELQNQFAEIVQKIESLKEKQNRSTNDINQLFDALMQKAFNGELIT